MSVQAANPAQSLPPLELRPPARSLFLTEVPRALSEVATLRWFSGPLSRAPKGDGHPVMVLPGFTASDSSTRVLRRFLERRGYSTVGWGLGRNLGPTPLLDGRIQERLEDVYREHGRKVSLIGQSLGGIFAREVGRAAPDLTRQVITLGSPFGGVPGAASNIQSLYEDVTGGSVEEVDADLLATLEVAPPVPTTAIYSRGDGIVHWRSCIQRQGEQAENLEVTGSHCGMGFNALVLYAVAERLAQPEDQWQTFERRGLRRAVYPKPEPCRGNSVTVSQPQGVVDDLAELAGEISENASEAVEKGAEIAGRSVEKLADELLEAAGEVAPGLERTVSRGVESTDRSLREIGILDFLGFEAFIAASSRVVDGSTDLRLALVEHGREVTRHRLDSLQALAESRSVKDVVRARAERRRKLNECRLETLRETGRIVGRMGTGVIEPFSSLMHPFASLVKNERSSCSRSK